MDAGIIEIVFFSRDRKDMLLFSLDKIHDLVYADLKIYKFDLEILIFPVENAVLSIRITDPQKKIRLQISTDRQFEPWVMTHSA